MSVKSAASGAVTKAVTSMRFVVACATIFNVKVYPVSYKKMKTNYELQMVLSPRLVDGAAQAGVNQSHSARGALVSQFVYGVRRSYPEAERFKLDQFQFRLLTVGEPFRATLRQHFEYFVLACLSYPGALLVSETH